MKIPLLSEISQYSDNGTPLALVLPQEHKLVKIYSELCGKLVNELNKETDKVVVSYSAVERKVFIEY
jgi:hypothetical protein